MKFTHLLGAHIFEGLLCRRHFDVGHDAHAALLFRDVFLLHLVFVTFPPRPLLASARAFDRFVAAAVDVRGRFARGRLGLYAGQDRVDQIFERFRCRFFRRIFVVYPGIFVTAFDQRLVFQFAAESEVGALGLVRFQLSLTAFAVALGSFQIIHSFFDLVLML